jgi:hypothetical protein
MKRLCVRTSDGRLIWSMPVDEVLALAAGFAVTIEDSAAEASPSESPQPPSAAPDLFAGAQWGPKREGDVGSAPIVCRLWDAKIEGGRISWKDDRPADWPKKTAGTATVNAVIYIGVRVTGGGWQVSKFDWVRPGQTIKGDENLLGGYPGFTPRRGVDVAFCIASIDGRQRSSASNVVKWP